MPFGKYSFAEHKPVGMVSFSELPGGRDGWHRFELAQLMPFSMGWVNILLTLFVL